MLIPVALHASVTLAYLTPSPITGRRLTMTSGDLAGRTMEGCSTRRRIFFHFQFMDLQEFIGLSFNGVTDIHD